MPRISVPAREPIADVERRQGRRRGAARHQPDAPFRGQVIELPELEDESPLAGRGDMPAVLEGPGDMGQARLSGPKVRGRALDEDTGLQAAEDLEIFQPLFPEDAAAQAARLGLEQGLEREPVVAEDAAVALQSGPGDEVEPVALAAGILFIGDDAGEGLADAAEAGDDEVDGFQSDPLIRASGRDFRDASSFIVFLIPPTPLG